MLLASPRALGPHGLDKVGLSDEMLTVRNRSNYTIMTAQEGQKRNAKNYTALLEKERGGDAAEDDHSEPGTGPSAVRELGRSNFFPSPEVSITLPTQESIQKFVKGGPLIGGLPKGEGETDGLE